MQNIITNHRSAAIIGFILAMPLALLFPAEVYNIEPLGSFFKGLTTEANGYKLNASGKILILGSLLLLPAGFVINFIPVARDLRAGNPLKTHLVNLILAAALFIFMAVPVFGFIVDQYPCWIGVPNCD